VIAVGNDHDTTEGNRRYKQVMKLGLQEVFIRVQQLRNSDE
jgi:hypothetical protein